MQVILAMTQDGLFDADRSGRFFWNEALNIQRTMAGFEAAVAMALVVVVALPSAPADAKIKRSSAARAEFKRHNPCPANSRPRGPCPGYIIDHVIALKRGGPDAASNMQWQTVAEAKEKDRWE